MVKVSMGARNPNAPPADYGMREDVHSLDRRMKMIEERHTNLRSKIQLTEQNMLAKNKTYFSEIKSLNVEMTDVKREIAEIKDKLISLIKDMEGFARRESVDILKKYIELWNPVRFVSKKDVEEIVMDVIDRLRKEG